MLASLKEVRCQDISAEKRASREGEMIVRGRKAKGVESMKKRKKTGGEDWKKNKIIIHFASVPL